MNVGFPSRSQRQVRMSRLEALHKSQLRSSDGTAAAIALRKKAQLEWKFNQIDRAHESSLKAGSLFAAASCHALAEEAFELSARAALLRERPWTCHLHLNAMIRQGLCVSLKRQKVADALRSVLQLLSWGVKRGHWKETHDLKHYESVTFERLMDLERQLGRPGTAFPWLVAIVCQGKDVNK